MTRQLAAVEVTSFIKGLVTEASPLTFPDNASISETNFVLNKDGTRRRRLGLDYEQGYQIIDTLAAPLATGDLATFSFSWKNPGGFPEKEFLAAQIGNRVLIFDATITPLSSGLLTNISIDGATVTQRFSMTNVDGVLVIVSGQRLITSVTYDGMTFNSSTNYLKIRDLFGVEDYSGGVNLREGNGVILRPSDTVPAHIYNLRNQTWAAPRFFDGGEVPLDPVSNFRSSFGYYQSNADSLIPYFYPRANDTEDRDTSRFNATDLNINTLGTSIAPMGYFIIDALQRGTSRLAAVTTLHSRYPQLNVYVSHLPQDTTPGGASVVGEFGGRVWYGGFSSQLIGGDALSPRMTSYILFSQLVDNISDIYNCYQEGDPTSTQTPELLATDGGFLRLDGAYNIQQMINVGNALMVVAENGVWRITGGSDYGFSATNYMTSKVTEHGCIAPNSIILIDNTFMYWSDDGIYHVAPNQFGDWSASNLTTATIQSYFDAIPFLEKTGVFGAYDAYERRVRWLYGNRVGDTAPNKELLLDVGIGAFYTNTIGQFETGNLPKAVSIVKVPPFSTGISSEQVTYNGVPVYYGLEPVVVSNISQLSSTAELVYMVVTDIVGTVKVTFAAYNNLQFRDWFSTNGLGIDAAAHVITGWSGGGDFQRNKQVPYVTVYSYKTETGFTLDSGGDFVAINPSSIKMRAMWEWTNSVDSGRWSEEFQAYRHNRFWTPDLIGSQYDDGNLLVITKNKLRGKGKVLSLSIKTEPYKDCYLIGWSIILSVSGTV